MATIGAADWFGLPVSTTHVLSFGIAGTMACESFRPARVHGAQSVDGLGADFARGDGARRFLVLGISRDVLNRLEQTLARNSPIACESARAAARPTLGLESDTLPQLCAVVHHAFGDDVLDLARVVNVFEGICPQDR
jgi:hypothetical protein